MKHTAESLRESFDPLTILVVGDMRLDKDIRVDFTRISSREQTGIPVGLSSGAENLIWGAGAAANLAMNLARMGVKVYCVGTWGNGYDPYRLALQNILSPERNILTGFMVAVRQTYCYGRYLVGGHLRDRYDVNIDPLQYADKAMLLNHLRYLRDHIGMNAIILSDYTEGNEAGGVIIPEVVQFVKGMGVPTFGSSRDHANMLEGIDHIVLNKSEWHNQRMNGILSTAITGGLEGVGLYTPDKDVILCTKPTAEVINPCGAGDTFFAAYAAAVTSRYEYEESCRIGMAAARHTVKQLVGTGHPSVEEIANEYEEIYGND